jgi:hypothetical protein
MYATHPRKSYIYAFLKQAELEELVSHQLHTAGVWV